MGLLADRKRARGAVHLDQDARWIAQVARGDHGALARLYERYAWRMLAVARTFVGLERDAEDLVHDVFLEIWRDAGDYDPKRGVARSWLFGRLRCRAIDKLRSPGHARAVFAAELEPEPLGAGEGDLGRECDRRAARARLAELEPELRMLLEMRYDQDLSSAEIAARVGRPVGTVKSRIAMALARLRAGYSPDQAYERDDSSES